MEVWRIVEEVPVYSVSNQGRVRNDRTGRILAPGLSRGYLVVVLCVNGKGMTCRVHRLVAKAFCDNPNALPFVDHVDRNMLNNNATNLRWASPSLNTHNQAARGAASRYKGVYRNGSKWQALIGVDRRLRYLGTFSTQEEAAAAYNGAAMLAYGEDACLNVL